MINLTKKIIENIIEINQIQVLYTLHVQFKTLPGCNVIFYVIDCNFSWKKKMK